MTYYRGFDIDHTFRIFKNGKQVFTAYWQRCPDLFWAKKTIDESVDHVPPVKKVQPISQRPCELENGQAEAERFAEAVGEYWEREPFNQ